MNKPLAVGVIGVGGMGGRHATNIRQRVPLARLAAVADLDIARAEDIAGPAGARVFTEPMELIAWPGVDAVIIASPDLTHASLAVACLNQGKPSLVEKPLATTLDDAEAVMKREIEVGRRLIQVGLMRHYDPEHAAVKDALERNEVGQPLLFRGWHRNPPEPSPPSSAEILINSAIHDLYSARWLLGQEIVEVQVIGTTIDKDRTDQMDLQVVTMAMDEGGIAIIEVNKDSGGYEVGVEVTGQRGIVTTPGFRSPVLRDQGRISQTVEPDWLERFALAYELEVESWVAAVTAGHGHGPSAWDGYQTLVAALAGVESIEGGASVRVDRVERPAMYS